VREIVTGEYRWASMEARVEDDAGVRDLEARLRAAPDTFRTILRLQIEGALALGARADLQRRLEDLAASFFHLEADLERVAARPTAEDFDSIDFDGVLRKAAERLKERAAAPNVTEQDRRIAQDALVELFLSRERSLTP